MQTIIISLGLLLTVLNIFDIGSTYVLLKEPNMEEYNPYVHYLIQSFGFWKAMIIAKGPPFFLIFIASFIVIYKQKERILILALSLLNIVYLHAMITYNLSYLVGT